MSTRLPPKDAAAALAAALAVAVVVLAAQRVGAAAFVLCLPCGALAVAVRRRTGRSAAGLLHLAHLDPLTGLGNARLLRSRLAYEIARHHRHRRQMALLVLDLDGFKAVNDRFGHPAGDELLREVARRLNRTVREGDTVIRQGGDEFCVLAPETGFRDAERLAARVQQAVHAAAGGLDGVSASIGYAVFPDEGATPEILLARADEAGLDAKRRSRAERPSLRVA
jgi:diguanylate cyclase (GGDEF)-like protein